MSFLKGRVRLGIPAALAVLTAVAVVVDVATFSLETVSPRDARDRASEDSATPPETAPGDVDCRQAKCLALTFDGNPGEPTDRLLDLLDQYGAPSTFFLEGRKIHEHPEVVRRIADEGHELGNHTWTHARLTEISDARVRDELNRTGEAITGLTGRRPTLMRPPEGRTDDRVSRVTEELGLAQILWTVTAKDYRTTDSALITERVLDGADRDGIILLHPLRKGTVPAMPRILRELTARGYSFVTVSQLLRPATAQPGKIYR
ncbi:polysaccharide deacetylase family protein [Streptomyces sp. NPDC088747]|uniref:polysaccharide deacetylase family protein n=1 Tax=Streptomyces sp. NPDC088747 TaxID=3365886 RepID=UPI0038095770